MKLLLLLPLLCLAACSDNADEAANLAEHITVNDFQYSLLPGGARIVTGEVHNASTQALSNIQVSITLFDANNRRISSMNVTVRDVPPGESKRFREPVQDSENVRGAKVRSVLVL